METTLIFEAGLDLPHFASFVLLDQTEGVETLRAYYRPYLEIARKRGVGIVLDTPTWRASADWGERLGYSAEALADVNHGGVALLEEVRANDGAEPPVVAPAATQPERRRRLLRDRSPAHRRDQRGLRYSVTTYSNEAQASSAKIAS